MFLVYTFQQKRNKKHAWSDFSTWPLNYLLDKH